MSITNKCRYAGSLLLSALLTNACAQQLPLDTAVHTGKLPNGFTWYIRHNTEPKHRVVFYLVNKIGSMQEDENQRGLAHFMEHMSFNGTAHYPKNELVEYLQKSGVRFGADLNAYTSFDETVYQLPLPSDDTAIVRNGLQIMRDWAGEATLEPTEIDKERGVVLEEKRLRNGAQQRMMEKYFPMQLNNSRYAQRLPIGLEKVLKTFTPATLKKFYKDWYRPDQQALIVVGDIDVQQMEQQVKQLFGNLHNPANERKRVHYTIPLTGKNQFMALTDAEQTRTQLQVLIKQPEMPLQTKADYRRAIVSELMNTALAERLQELRTRSNPPFVQAQAGFSGFMGGLSAFGVTVIPKPGQLEEAFTIVWTEVQRMKTLGLTPAELERGKKAYLHQFETAYREKDKTPSQSYVKEYVQYFLKGTAAPGIDAEYQLVKELLPQITLQEVHTFAQQVIRDTDRDILVLAPEKDKASLPDAAAVNSWIAQVAKKTLTPWKEENDAEGLLKTMPLAGKVIKRTYLDSIGVTELLLSNGAKVLIKPTNFKNDQVLFTAFSEGGSSLYPDSLYLDAANAGQLIAANGIGNADPVTLSRLLTGKSASAQPYIQERYEGMSGGATPADLETALQLMYLHFTAPREDSNIFNSIISRGKASLAGKDSNPEAVFADSVGLILGMHNYRRLPMTVTRLDSIDQDKMLRIYKERFANAGDFTFIFTGSIDTAKLIPLVAQYIGSLPANGTHETARNLGIHVPDGHFSQTINKGKDNKAVVNLYYSGQFTYSDKQTIQLAALGSVLQYRMLERIREAEGGAYTPRAGVNYSKLPEARYTFSIQFTCAPENVSRLVAAAKDEISKLQAAGPPADDIKKFTAEQSRSVELQLQSNTFWLQYLAARLQNDEPLTGILHFNSRLQQVTPASVQQAAKQYLSDKNCIQLTLMPEANK